VGVFRFYGAAALGRKDDGRIDAQRLDGFGVTGLPVARVGGGIWAGAGAGLLALF
jgi:hypothetical protein